MVGDSHSTRVLRKLLNQPSKDVRLAVILSVAKYQRDDLLPQIRQQAGQLQFALQEAAALTFGALKDEESIPILEKLISSQYPTVALAAHVALYQLGKKESIKAIERAAQNGDLFAISSLGSIPDHPKILLELIENSNQHIRFNAMIALLDQNHSKALEKIDEIIIRNKEDLAFTPYQSPGHAFQAWKVTSSANQLLKNDLEAYSHHLKLKETLLEKVCHLSSSHFIALAHRIFSKQHNELIPITAQ